MAMERWELVQRARGNTAGAEMARVLREQFGDVPLPSVAVPVEKRPFSSNSKLLILSREDTPKPKEVLDILQEAELAGMSAFDAHLFPGVTLRKDCDYQGWNKKPEDWYWEQITKGSLSPNAPTLSGSWVLVDKTPRPNYRDGKQLHKNDPFGPLLKRLREEGKIQNIKDIPITSRFGISPNELTQFVLPEIAQLLGVEALQVRLPKEIEFNVLGNLFYPYWGEVNTAEWFEDVFGDSRRLIGGGSGGGGLVRVYGPWSGLHSDFVAFRPLVVVSPKA